MDADKNEVTRDREKNERALNKRMMKKSIYLN